MAMPKIDQRASDDNHEDRNTKQSPIGNLDWCETIGIFFQLAVHFFSFFMTTINVE